MVDIKINKTLRNVLIGVLLIVLLFVIGSLFPDKDFREKYEGFDLSSSTEMQSSTRTYSEYLELYSKKKEAKQTVNVDVFAYDEDKSYGVRIQDDCYGKKVVVTEDRSSITWNVDVQEEGFYNISMEYVCIPSRNVEMERILYINGEVPFSGADILSFARLWKDGGEVKFDNQGNSIRPTQIEYFDFQTVRFKSDLGYEVDPYRFYLKKGVNEITFESTNEPMGIVSFEFVPVQKYDSYEQYVAKQKSKPEDFNKEVEVIKVQGESSQSRSDPSLFARYDRSSAITEPYSVKNTVLNYIGGDSWRAPGQWIEWGFEVPETGWYNISVQARQLFQRGYVACRSVYIDGQIPMQELKSVGFPFSSDWKTTVNSDKDENPINFFLTKGKHTIRLEATLGDVGRIISDLQDSIYRLNQMYRTILVLTGTYPDPFRDYEIHKVYPEVVEGMMLESRRLYKCIDEFVQVTGQKSDKIAIAETLAIQLEQFYKYPDRITKSFANFKSNISTLGSSLLSLTETKLDIDYIEVVPVNKKIAKKRSSFFKKAKHELVSFVTSFIVDSSQLGNVYEDDADHLIEVWIVTGRDQSQILKNMVDESFTPNTGIKVNVKLIDIGALLNAVVAGNGPDVVISVGRSIPVDYALRNANVNLMRFEDCDEVLQNFYPSAYEAYKYDDGLYALPETESFNLLFYRKDILEQLDVELPQTWDDLIAILPTLQGNNLDVAIPYPSIQAPDMRAFYTMIYQNDGVIYNDKGTKSLIDSEPGIAAFKKYTSFFNSYGLPTVYDFISRFRSGEMPLGITDYQTYNTLTVSAPEIRGLWDFTYILGTEKTDVNGKTYIDRTNGVDGVATMMIKKGMDMEDLKSILGTTDYAYSSQDGTKLDASLFESVDEKTLKAVLKNEERMSDSWEFMKWWVSTDIQLRFGREMEALLGSSARYATANVEALKQLSWNSKQLEILEDSLEQSRGLPEVPGSYFTPRHVVNGARKVINEKDDPRETLIDYTRKINEELLRKRQEFNLPVE
jgi:ABC-type glycerol-3-phosphate transport system substrate-binding protein